MKLNLNIRSNHNIEYTADWICFIGNNFKQVFEIEKWEPVCDGDRTGFVTDIHLSRVPHCIDIDRMSFADIYTLIQKATQITIGLYPSDENDSIADDEFTICHGYLSSDGVMFHFAFTPKLIRP